MGEFFQVEKGKERREDCMMENWGNWIWILQCSDWTQVFWSLLMDICLCVCLIDKQHAQDFGGLFRKATVLIRPSVCLLDK